MNIEIARARGNAIMRIVALVAACVIACTGAAEASDRVVIAQSDDTLIWAPLYIARKLDYFKDEGIDLQVAIVKSGPAALTAVTTGSAQIAMGFPATPIQAIGKGLDVKIFAELCNQFIAELMLRNDVAARLQLDAASPIEARLRGLKGLTIATNGTGSANDYLLRRMVRDAGLRDGDVTITPIGAGATILAAVDQKRIDGFVATPPINFIATRDHASTQLIDFTTGEYRPVAGIIYVGLAASEDWLKANPALASRVVRAVARALALMHDDPAAAKAAVRTFFPGTDQALFDAGWESQLASFPKTPRLAPADIATTMDFAAIMLGRPVGIDASRIFTNDYVDLAEKPK